MCIREKDNTSISAFVEGLVPNKRGIRVYVKGKTAWLMLWLTIESDASNPSAALSITSLLLPGYFSVRNVSVVQRLDKFIRLR